MSSANLAKAKIYEAIIQEYAPGLVSQGLFGFKTADFVQVGEGNKGLRTITEGSVNDITYEGGGLYGFNPVPGAFDYTPRDILVSAQSVDLEFIPQQFEETYIGSARKKGQNSGTDLPYEAWHMMKIMDKMANELERAVWQGVKVAPLPGGQRRKLLQNLNGFFKVITDELAVGSSNFTPFAVPGGAWTDTNAVINLEKMAERLDSDTQSQKLYAYCGIHLVNKYRRNMREAYKKYTDTSIALNQIQMEIGDVTLIGLPGLGMSNRVIITTPENLVIDFDSIDDTKFINVESNKRKIEMWADYKVGVNLQIVHNDKVSVCDIA